MQKVFLEVVVPPDIISTGTSTDTTVVENKSATLECKARGVPKPSISWKREDGREIVIRNTNNEKDKGKRIIFFLFHKVNLLMFKSQFV